jgi:hypothetical protein
VSEAIIIVGSNRRPVEQPASPRWTPETAVGGEGLAALELLGQSVLQRTVAEVGKAKVDGISVCVDVPVSSGVDDNDANLASSVMNAWEVAGERLRQFAKKGTESVLIVELSEYVELDFPELLRLHHESGKAVTRAFHEAGPMGLWVVNPAMLADIQELRGVLDESVGAEFYTSGYINRLETPADLRRLVNDGLGCRCQFRPQGFELKPGIWMAPGAQVEKAARIVAPAFIGRGVNIGGECLITRGSSVESDSEIDYGTTIEDSSILSNTYVGIGLDLSHSIAHGSSLLNLQHDVRLQISDPAVMRQNKQLAAGDRNFAFDAGTGEAVATLKQDR